MWPHSQVRTSTGAAVGEALSPFYLGRPKWELCHFFAADDRRPTSPPLRAYPADMPASRSSPDLPARGASAGEALYQRDTHSRPTCPPAHSWPGTGRDGRPRLAWPADPRHLYIDLTLWGWCSWKVWFRRPGTLSGPRRSGTGRSLPDLPAWAKPSARPPAGTLGPGRHSRRARGRMPRAIAGWGLPGLPARATLPASAETPSPGERGGRALPGLPARATLPASAETPPARTPAEAHPACPPARTFLAWHREGGTAPARMARRPPPPIYRFNPLGVVQVKSVVPTPGNSFGASPLRHRPKFARPACLGETVCQAASGHPRAGETLSQGARADAPGDRRLRSTRPPRPGNIARFGRDTVAGRTRGPSSTRPPRPGNIARFGRDPARANTGRGSPGLPARPHILGLAPGGRDGPGSHGSPTPATHI